MFLWLIFVTALLVSGIYLFIRNLLVVVTVESTSMSPTLLDGDRVLVLRYWPATLLQKGNIVIIWPGRITEPDDRSGPFNVTPFIKRVVALPGEKIVTRFDELDEFHKSKPFLRSKHDINGNREWHIPPGHFFVRGDNPIGSFDSLSWGPIPDRSLLGIVVMKLSHKADPSSSSHS